MAYWNGAYQSHQAATSQLPPTVTVNEQIARQVIEILCREKKSLSLRDLVFRLGNQSHLRLSERQLHDIIVKYPNNFNFVHKDREIENVYVSAVTKLGLCREHCSKMGRCQGFPACDGLHICKFYLLSNSCRVAKQGKTCLFGHDLTSTHNMQLRKRHLLDHLSTADIKSLFRNTESRSRATLPSICKFYNISVGCRAEAEGKPCPYLHMCKFYILGQCRFGKGCKRSHDIFNPQVKDILTKYGIDICRSPKEILAEIRSADFDMGDDTSSQASSSVADMHRRMEEVDQELSSDEEAEEGEESQTTVSALDPTAAEICIFYLRGRCAFGKSCRKLHTNTMYVWQYCKRDLHQWSNFPPESNTEIELTYSDVNKSECFLRGSDGMMIKLNFDTMKGQGVMHGQIVLQLDIRRLSTASSEKEKFQPLATTWRWYWYDDSGLWCEYGQEIVVGSKATVDSSSLEQSYLENPNGHMAFSTLGHTYLMDFQTMSQKNTVHRTKRRVRRRPVFVDLREMEARKKQSPSTGAARGKPVSSVTGPALDKPLMAYIPDTWELTSHARTGDHISDHYQRTVITGVGRYTKEIQEIKELFYKTMPSTAYITCVERIENGELWMNFVSKREKMKRKNKAGYVHERKLFHGTTSKYVDAICRQGFDFRFSGKTSGTKYGKGSYFAKSARYADSYTDYGREKEMFLVKVLAGEFAKGDKSMVRPPPKSLLDPFELFDSCVDDVANPNIFVIFTFDQVYPEYVIKYCTKPDTMLV